MARTMGSEITKLQHSAMENICSEVVAYRRDDGNAIVEIGKGDTKVAFAISPLGKPVDVKVIDLKAITLSKPAQAQEEKRSSGRPRKVEILAKRGPGRPRKVEANGAHPKTLGRPKKRRPGRPMGSKNKPKEMATA